MKPSDLVGTWKIKWSSGDTSTYAIESSNSQTSINIVSCSWESSTTCVTNSNGKAQPSTNPKYPKDGGWSEVKKIHGGDVTIYLRLVKDELEFIWLRSAGYMEAGKGLKG